MTSRNLPWVFLGLAAALAVVAIAYSGFEPYTEEHHDAFSHVNDAFEFHLTGSESEDDARHRTIPLVRFVGEAGDVFQAGISKFMVLELIAAGLIAVVFIPMARRLASGEPPRGAWDNTFDSVLTFIRNEVAKPNIGEHDADKYVPFLWTLFLFILTCNLLGMLPWMGSPTANLYATGALAVIALVMMHGAPIVSMGPIQYVKSLWPHVEVVQNPWRPHGEAHGHERGETSPAESAHQPATKPTLAQIMTWIGGSAFGILLCLMIFVIEVLGTLIKSGVLAVRLFANMFAGHTVLAMILGFVVLAGNAAPLLWTGITGASVLGVAALSLLELFVAFLQSYIFVFLTSLFVGMALHPSH